MGDPDSPTAVVISHQIVRRRVDPDGRHGLFCVPSMEGEGSGWVRSMLRTLTRRAFDKIFEIGRASRFMASKKT